MGEAKTLFFAGEQLETKLHGESKLVDVKLDRTEVDIPRAFIGLTCHASFQIINTVSERLDFSWKKNPSAEEGKNYFFSFNQI